MPSLDIQISPQQAIRGARQIETSLARIASAAINAQQQVDKIGRARGRARGPILPGIPQASNEVDALRRRIGQLEEQLMRLGRGGRSSPAFTIGAIGTAAFVAVRGLTALTRTYADLTGELNRVRAVTGANSVEFAKIEALITELGATTAFTARQVASGAAFLGQAGFNTNKILAALPATLRLATAGSLDLGRAADITANALSQFGLGASETQRVADVLAVTATSSLTNIEQLAQALSFSGGVAAAFGVEIEEVAAVLGVFGNAGIPATRAGTALRGILSDLARQATPAREALSEMNLSIRDVDIRAKGLIPVLRTLIERGVNEGSRAFRIFGDEQVPAIAALQKQIDLLPKLADANRRATGAVKELADIMLEGLPGALAEATSALEAARVAAGNAGLEGGLENVLDATTALLREGVPAFESFGAAGAVVLRTIAGSAVLAGFSLSGLGKTIAATAAQIAAIFDSTTTIAGIEDEFQKDILALEARRDAVLNQIFNPPPRPGPIDRSNAPRRPEAERTPTNFSASDLAGPGRRGGRRSFRTASTIIAESRATTQLNQSLLAEAQVRGLTSDQLTIERRVREQVNQLAAAGQVVTTAQATTLRGLATESQIAEQSLRGYLDAQMTLRGISLDATQAQEEFALAIRTSANSVERAVEIQIQALQRQRQENRQPLFDPDGLRTQLEQIEQIQRQARTADVGSGLIASAQQQQEFLRTQASLLGEDASIRTVRLQLLEEEQRLLEQGLPALINRDEVLRALLQTEQARQSLGRGQVAEDLRQEVAGLRDLVGAQGLSRQEREASVALFDLEQQARQAGLEGLGEEREAVIALIGQRQQLTQELERGNSALRRFAEDAEDSFDEIQQVGVTALNGLTDSLIEVSRTGKISFSELADSAVASIQRIAIQQLIFARIARALDAGLQGGAGGGGIGGFLSGFGGSFGVGGGADLQTNVNLSGGNDFITAGTLARGGLSHAPPETRVVPAALFNNAPRFQRGGEIPALLHRGERVLNPQETRDFNNRDRPIVVNVTQILPGVRNAEEFTAGPTRSQIEASLIKSVNRTAARSGIAGNGR